MVSLMKYNIPLIAFLFLALFVIGTADASSNYTLRTAGKDANTTEMLNATMVWNGTAKIGTPWADFNVPANTDISVTHAHAGYYSDTDVYFFDAMLTSCTTTPTCTIDNNGYRTECTNISDSNTVKYSCSVAKNNVAFYFVFYPAANGVLTTNELVRESNQPPVINSLGANATSGTTPLLVRFEPNITFNSGSTVQAIEWNFGDGTPVSSEYNVTHLFNGTGNYTVQLTVFDSNGLNDRENITITVTEAAVAPVPPPSGGGGGGSTTTTSSSGGRRKSGGGGSVPAVVVPVKKEPVQPVDLGASEAVDIMSVSIPELHVNQPASILVTLQSTKPMDVSVTLTVDGAEIETQKVAIDGTNEIEFIYLPTVEGEHEFSITMSAKDGTENWRDTAVVQPEVIEQNITTGMSLSNLFKPLYVIILLSVLAVGVVVWKRNEIRQYLNI